VIQNTLRLLADFHGVDDADRLVVSASYAQGAALVLVPSVGDRVLLDDGEGHTCWAAVVEVRWPLLDVHIDWATWRRVSAIEILEKPTPNPRGRRSELELTQSTPPMEVRFS
jgi:hypothetical protein